MDGLSLSDVAAVTRDNDGWGNGGAMWIIVLFALIFGWGNNGWGGNNGFANAIGYENLATSNEVQRGFDNQNSMANQREILAAVNAGTAQGVAATNQSFHDILAAFGDKYSELQRDIAAIAVGQANALANQNQCCCETKMLIQENAAQQRYDSAMQMAAINANTTEQAQKILDAITGNRIADMQNQINGLNQALNTQALQNEIREATQGVVRYPEGFVYNAGNNPFCGCGVSGCCNI